MKNQIKATIFIIYYTMYEYIHTYIYMFVNS